MLESACQDHDGIEDRSHRWLLTFWEGVFLARACNMFAALPIESVLDIKDIVAAVSSLKQVDMQRLENGIWNSEILA